MPTLGIKLQISQYLILSLDTKVGVPALSTSNQIHAKKQRPNRGEQFVANTIEFHYATGRRGRSDAATGLLLCWACGSKSPELELFRGQTVTGLFTVTPWQVAQTFSSIATISSRWRGTCSRLVQKNRPGNCSRCFTSSPAWWQKFWRVMKPVQLNDEFLLVLNYKYW